MRKIDYKPGGLANGIALSFAMMMLFGWLWWTDDWAPGLFVMLLFAVIGGVSVRALLRGRPALAWDRDQLVVNTFFRSSTLAWSEVRDIAIQQIVLRYMGVIPISKQTYLTIGADGGMFGRTLRLQAGALDLPTGGIAALCASLIAQRVATVGEVGVAMQGAGPQGWGAARPASAAVGNGGDSFDPDAALARYLAAKQSEQQGAAPPPGSAAAPAPLMPARPSFGRRTA